MLAVTAALAFCTPAAADPSSVEIFASANSSSGGTALDSGLNLVAGDRLVSSVDPLDCWSAGAANRISNANGLDGTSPAPCQPTGDYGFHSQDGETFRYGSLVGRIDGGDWFLLGTGFDAVVSATGRLFLAYWDSNAGDNFGSVTASISVNPSEVPEPGTLGLVGLALLGIASLRRRRE
ncbi:MAG: PEP-CTERM sorting domain-containing protein [Burkholderiaceae bacterium]